MADIHERWDAVMELFGEMMDASPDERERIFAECATEDEDVVREVRSLLEAHRSNGDRFEKPALARIAGTDGHWFVDATPTLVGQRVGPYEIVRKIGEGGMGAVYEAKRVGDTYQQRVALKTISRGADSQTIVQRFRRERQILAGLQHPNIAAMYDGGVTEAGTPYFVMEYVDGLTIDAWCAQHQLTIAQRLDLFRQVCAAVQHAHRRLVVHRDIKPGNVLVSNDGVVKLLDFGIAKLVTIDSDGGNSDPSVTRDGLSPLTTAYASPEQVRGDAVSTATDVYSLGVVLYQLLSGVAPVQSAGKSPTQILVAIAEENPPLPSVACTHEAARNARMSGRDKLSKALSGELDSIVMMAMRKEPERRYASADALASDLHRYLKGLPVSARPDTIGYRARKFMQRRSALVAISATAFGAIAIFGTVAFTQARATRREEARTARISNFMQSMLGAADVTGVGGSLSRVGPRATVSALLDSALQQVPKSFPDDPAIRARLYTTLGSGLITQTRLREAYDVLDSAMTLSRQVYGEKSVEFALATNEASTAALHRNRLAVSDSLVHLTQRALELSDKTETEMYAQTFVNLASIALVRGDYRLMDSLAQHALDLEMRRTREPSLARASALNRLGARQMLLNHAASADTLYRRALAMLESLHATHSLERVDLMNNLAGAVAAQRGVEPADSVVREGMRLAEDVFGSGSREYALLISNHAFLRALGGDTADARLISERSQQILDSIPEMVLQVAAEIRFARAAYLTATGQWQSADSVLTIAINSMSEIRRGLPLAQMFTYRAGARSMMHDLRNAKADVERVDQVVRDTDMDQPGFLGLFNLTAAAVYARLGDVHNAERFYKVIDPQVAGRIKVFAAQQHAADSIALASTERRTEKR